MLSIPVLSIAAARQTSKAIDRRTYPLLPTNTLLHILHSLHNPIFGLLNLPLHLRRIPYLVLLGPLGYEIRLAKLLFPATHVPVPYESTVVEYLRRRVRRVTGEEEVVSWLDSPCCRRALAFC